MIYNSDKYWIKWIQDNNPSASEIYDLWLRRKSNWSEEVRATMELYLEIAMV